MIGLRLNPEVNGTKLSRVWSEGATGLNSARGLLALPQRWYQKKEISHGGRGGHGGELTVVVVVFGIDI
jgi:hypothetical protein